jgi:glucosamine--fructose-6-phosphate aminotransferase (isomerizing)
VTEKLIGSFAIAVIFSDHDGKIFGARRGSPLAVGVGDGEMFLVSDPNAIVKHTRKVVFLEDDEVVEIGKEDFYIERSDRSIVTRNTTEIPYGTDAIELSGYKTYMEKEIHEQPESLLNGFRGRLLMDEASVRLEEMEISDSALRQIKDIKIIACGTSWHAGLLGKYLIEEMSRIPVEVDYAAEFRYRNPVIPDDCLVIAISQSGETADTLAAVREARIRGATVCSICNVVGSSLARESDHVIYLHAGPEIGVASTKAFTNQVLVLTLLAIKLGRMKNLGRHKALQLLGMIKSLPSLVERSLGQDNNIREIADEVYRQPNFLFTGRRYQFPVALEGALKLKEISYIHAEGLQAAELKHGPIALVDEEMPVVVIGTECDILDKVKSNIEEIKARRGRIIAVTTEGCSELDGLYEWKIEVPQIPEPLAPILTVIPLQLLAYHVARLRGCDVDKPRNLAKSVTVE